MLERLLHRLALRELEHGVVGGLVVDRDHVVELAGRLYLVTGIEREKRFGLADAGERTRAERSVQPTPAWASRGGSEALDSMHAASAGA